uniref:Golgi integral membrane protein 4a n=1 Tax=Acanthochromis polyacanthus TaxID=80966 RepID=A0A3Q1FGI8_9TELE
MQVDEYKQFKESLKRVPNVDPHRELHQEPQLQHQAQAQVEHVKSAYEQQQEQQRLEAQRAEERRQIQMRQENLQAQRERVLKEREQRLKEEQEREEQQHREADRREQQLREEHQRSDLNKVHIEFAQIMKFLIYFLFILALLYSLKFCLIFLWVPEEEQEIVEEEEEPAAPAQHIDAHPGPEQPAVEEELVVSKRTETNKIIQGNSQVHRSYIQHQLHQVQRSQPQEDTEWCSEGKSRICE